MTRREKPRIKLDEPLPRTDGVRTCRSIRVFIIAAVCCNLQCSELRDPSSPSLDKMECQIVGMIGDNRQLQAMSARYGRILTVGEAIVVCPCQRRLGGDAESRRLSGGTEQRQIGGSIEQRRLGGGVEQQQLGGAVEDRRLGGSAEARKIGGGIEGRKLGGTTENRIIGGAAGALVCSYIPLCPGFVVSGIAPVRIYDGGTFYTLQDRCVR